MYPRIRILRENGDLSQTYVAQILNVNQTTYSRYEGGVLGVPSALLIKLAKFYNTSIDYMIGLIDNKNPYSK